MRDVYEFAAVTSTWALVSVTGSLAIFTALMALSTRNAARSANRTAAVAEQDIRQGADLVRIGQQQIETSQHHVEAARDQAVLAMKALAIESQPLLVPTTPLEEWNPSDSLQFSAFERTVSVQEFPVAKAIAMDNAVWVILKLRNVGRGAALIGMDAADTRIEAGGVTTWGLPMATVMAPGDRTFVLFNGEANSIWEKDTLRAAVQTAVGMTVTLVYTDIAHQRRFETSVHLGSDRPDPTVTDVVFEEITGTS